MSNENQPMPNPNDVPKKYSEMNQNERAHMLCFLSALKLIGNFVDFSGHSSDVKDHIVFNPVKHYMSSRINDFKKLMKTPEQELEVMQSIFKKQKSLAKAGQFTCNMAYYQA